MHIRRPAPLVAALALGLAGCGAVTDAGPRSSATPQPSRSSVLADDEAAAEPAGGRADDDAAASPPGTPSLPLSSITDRARELDAELDGDVATVVVDLSTGEWAGHQGSTVFTSASLYKLYVAASALDLVDTGEMTLEHPVGGGCGSLAYTLEIVVVVSDNACAIQLGSVLGWDAVEAFVEAQGFVGTTFHIVPHGTGWVTTGQETTAADTADLLTRLAEGELLAPDSTQLFLDLLHEQYFGSALSEELRAVGDTFGHKLGTLADVSHDAGILVVDERRYVVAVLTGGWPGWAEPAAAPALEGVGEAVVDYAEARAAAATS